MTRSGLERKSGGVVGGGPGKGTAWAEVLGREAGRREEPTSNVTGATLPLFSSLVGSPRGGQNLRPQEVSPRTRRPQFPSELTQGPVFPQTSV